MGAESTERVAALVIIPTPKLVNASVGALTKNERCKAMLPLLWVLTWLRANWTSLDSATEVRPVSAPPMNRKAAPAVLLCEAEVKL